MYRKSVAGWLTLSQVFVVALLAYAEPQPHVLSNLSRRQDPSDPNADGTPSTPPIVFPEQCQIVCSAVGDASLCDGTATGCLCDTDVRAQIAQCYQCLVQAGTFTQEAADDELNKLLGSCSTTAPETPTPTSSPSDGGGEPGNPGGNTGSDPITRSGSSGTSFPTSTLTDSSGPSGIPGGGGNGDSNGATAGSDGSSSGGSANSAQRVGLGLGGNAIVLMFAGTILSGLLQ